MKSTGEMTKGFLGAGLILLFVFPMVVVAGALLAPSAASAQQSVQEGSYEVVVVSSGPGTETLYTTFEPGTTLLADVGMNFGPEWVTFPVPGLGQPSDPTVALWLADVPFGEVSLAFLVQEVFLSYASSVPVFLAAYDAGGALVDSVSGPAGMLTEWRQLSVSGDGITRISLFGAAGMTGIDDFGYSRSVAVEVGVDIKPGSDPNSINPRSRGRIPVAIVTTPTFDATTVDPTTIAFGPNGGSGNWGQVLYLAICHPLC